jgi:hypothetical protein
MTKHPESYVTVKIPGIHRMRLQLRHSVLNILLPKERYHTCERPLHPDLDRLKFQKRR